MPFAKQLREYGPKSLYIPAPRVVTFSGNNTSHSVSPNTGPHAGQQWRIDSIFFRFPESEKSKTVEKIEAEIKEVSFTIVALVNGQKRAEQVFKESGQLKTITAATGFKLVGALEAFTPIIIGPGETLTVEYEVESNDASIQLSSGQGEIVITYTLLAR
jgi:hypothetical protein